MFGDLSSTPTNKFCKPSIGTFNQRNFSTLTVLATFIFEKIMKSSLKENLC